MTSNEFKYDLFLSYSTEPDYELSRKVESFLESFHNLIVDERYSLKSLQICRDGSDFELHQILEDAKAFDEENEAFTKKTIAKYLSKSQHLLVLCSKNSAKSDYIDFEIEWFLKKRPDGKVFLAISEGEEIKPDTTELFSSQILKNGLPYHLAFDFRGYKKESTSWKKVKNFNDELVNLASQLNGHSSGELSPIWRREEKERLLRERRRLIKQRAILVLVAIIAIVAGSIAYYQKGIANEKTQLAETGRLAALSISQSQDKKFTDALLLAKKADSIGGHLDYATVYDAYYNIGDSENNDKLLVFRNYLSKDSSIHQAIFSPDSKNILAIIKPEGIALLKNLNGQTLKKIALKERKIVSALFLEDGKILTRSKDENNFNHIDLWNKEGEFVKKIVQVDHNIQLDDYDLSREASLPKIFGIDSKDQFKDSLDVNLKNLYITDKNGDLINRFSTSGINTPKAKFLSGTRMFVLFDAIPIDNAKIYDVDGNFISSIKKHTAGVQDILISPDHKYILTYSRDKTMRLWEFNSSPFYNKFGLTTSKNRKNNTTVRLSHDLKTLSFRTDTVIEILERDNIELKRSYTTADKINFYKDGTALQNSVLNKDSLIIKDLSGKALLNQKFSKKLTCSNIEPVFLFRKNPDTVGIWNYPDKAVTNLYLPQNDNSVLMINTNGDYLIEENDKEHKIVLTKWKSGDKYRIQLAAESLKSTRYSQNSELIFVQYKNKEAELWNSKLNKKYSIPLKSLVRGKRFSKDGNLLVTIDKDNSAQVWNKEGKRIFETKPSDGRLVDFAFSSDSKSFLLTVNKKKEREKKLLNQRDEREVIQYNLDGKKINHIIPLYGHRINQVKFLRSKNQLITSAFDSNTLKLWNGKGELLADIDFPMIVKHFSISPDGNYLVVRTKKSFHIWPLLETLREWDIQTEPFSKRERLLYKIE